MVPYSEIGQHYSREVIPKLTFLVVTTNIFALTPSTVVDYMTYPFEVSAYPVYVPDIGLLLSTIIGGQEYGHYLDGDGYLTRVTIDNGKVVGIALEFQLLH